MRELKKDIEAIYPDVFEGSTLKRSLLYNVYGSTMKWGGMPSCILVQ